MLPLSRICPSRGDAQQTCCTAQLKRDRTTQSTARDHTTVSVASDSGAHRRKFSPLSSPRLPPPPQPPHAQTRAPLTPHSLAPGPAPGAPPRQAHGTVTVTPALAAKRQQETVEAGPHHPASVRFLLRPAAFPFLSLRAIAIAAAAAAHSTPPRPREPLLLPKVAGR